MGTVVYIAIRHAGFMIGVRQVERRAGQTGRPAGRSGKNWAEGGGAGLSKISRLWLASGRGVVEWVS